MVNSNIEMEIEIRVECIEAKKQKHLTLICKNAIEKSWEIAQTKLSKDHCLSNVKTGSIEVSVICISETDMYELNMKHRGQQKPTNVLSFQGDLSPPPGETVLLGDIALCWKVIEKEAFNLDIPVENHLAHLTIHGVLHLLGYDHNTALIAKKMEQLECHILSTMGIESPYEEIQGPYEH